MSEIIIILILLLNTYFISKICENQVKTGELLKMMIRGYIDE